MNPGVNGISGDCIIDIKDDMTKNLERCYEAIKDNKYFKNGLGWILEAGSRPQIKLILPEDIQKEFDDEKDKLTKDIMRFYQNCSYPGD